MRPKTGLPSDLGPKGRPLLSSEPEIVPLQRDWMSRAVVMMAIVLVAVAAFGVWLRFRPIPYQTDRWMDAGGFDRGRMLDALLTQTRFVDFPRTDVERYLGPADFDERQFWYDLGPADAESVVEPRAMVGDTSRLYAVFSFDRDAKITQVLYSRRRPVLGSENFDESEWSGSNHSRRRAMFIRVLGKLRATSFDRWNAESLLGTPDGVRVRTHYDVGLGGAFIGTHKALVLEYDESDVVRSATVVD